MPLRSACGLVLAALLPAQARQPAFGVVTDAQGQPVAGARVTCVGSAWFGDEAAAADLVELATDARGRFVARLLPARVYSLWAATAADAAGRFACTEVREAVACGSQLQLQLSAPRPPQRLRLRGAEAWPGERLRLQAVPRAASVLRLPVEDGVPLPPAPPIGRALVVDGDGAVLWLVEAPAAAPAEWTVDLPPPHAVDVQVEDAAGRPLAGAVLDHTAGALRPQGCGWLPLPQLCSWRRAGSTDAEGRAQLRLPVLVDDDGAICGVHLRARMPGYAEQHAGNAAGGRTFVAGESSRTHATPVLRLQLDRAGRLQLDGPRPDGQLLLFQTLASGDRIVDGCQPFLPGTAAALPAPRARDRGSVVLSIDTAGQPPLYALAAAANGGRRVDLRARSLRVAVRDAQKGPAHGVLAVLLPWGALPPFTPPLPLPLDQAGRGEVRLGGGDWLLFAATEDSVGWRSLRRADGDQDWQLDLQPLQYGSVRVFAGNRPAAGAAVAAVRLGMRGDFVWDGECGAVATLLQHVQPRLLQGRAVDAGGRLRLPLLPLPCWSVGVRIVRGAAESEFVDVLPGEVVDVFL